MDSQSFENTEPAKVSKETMKEWTGKQMWEYLTKNNLRVNGVIIDDDASSVMKEWDAEIWSEFMSQDNPIISQEDFIDFIENEFMR